MKKFINEEMFEIIQYLENELKTDTEISIEVLNPNIKDNNGLSVLDYANSSTDNELKQILNF